MTTVKELIEKLTTMPPDAPIELETVPFDTDYLDVYALGDVVVVTNIDSKGV
jgi:hypothetical protein